MYIGRCVSYYLYVMNYHHRQLPSHILVLVDTHVFFNCMLELYGGYIVILARRNSCGQLSECNNNQLIDQLYVSYSIHAIISTCSIYSSIAAVVVFMLAITCMFMQL